MVRNRLVRLCIGGLALLYGLLYLFAIGDLDLGASGWGAQVLDWRWERLLARRGPWQFEAVAMFELGSLVLLVSPLNLLIAGLLAVLLAFNLLGALALAGSSQVLAQTAGGSQCWGVARFARRRRLLCAQLAVGTGDSRGGGLCRPVRLAAATVVDAIGA